MYHISDVKKYLKCIRLFKLRKDYVEGSFLYLEKNITDLVIKKLNLENYFLGRVGDEKENALEALKNYDVLVKARFEYNNLRIKVPFLIKNKEEWDIYFLYTSTWPHKDDMLFYLLQLWVLRGNNIKINRIHIIHLNEDYVRGDDLDCDKLFTISTCFYTSKNKEGDNVKEVLFENFKDYSSLLKKVEACDKDDLAIEKHLDDVKNDRCKCVFCSEVLNESLPENSILHLTSSQYKKQMFNEGILRLKDADLEKIEATRKQYAQIMADEKGGLFYDLLALKAWLKPIKEPLMFLDFEWQTLIIPPYKKMSPNDALVFEYSLHILDKENISHKSYIGFDDCREDFIVNLINDCRSKGTIFAYNANAAEKMRIKELAKWYPKYAKKLMNIHDRIVDLQKPFEAGLIYDTRMAGQYSLKKLMSIIDENAYTSLDIGQALDAVNAYKKLDTINNSSEKQEVIENLINYCSMDTYAMVRVYKWIINIIKEEDVK